MYMPNIWESVAEDTYRMPVPGGWLVKVQLYVTLVIFDRLNTPINTTKEEISLTFVSDPDHTWDEFNSNLYKLNEQIT